MAPCCICKSCGVTKVSAMLSPGDTSICIGSVLTGISLLARSGRIAPLRRSEARFRVQTGVATEGCWRFVRHAAYPQRTGAAVSRSRRRRCLVVSRYNLLGTQPSQKTVRRKLHHDAGSGAAAMETRRIQHTYSPTAVVARHEVAFNQVTLCLRQPQLCDNMPDSMVHACPCVLVVHCICRNQAPARVRRVPSFAAGGLLSGPLTSRLHQMPCTACEREDEAGRPDSYADQHAAHAPPWQRGLVLTQTLDLDLAVTGTDCM